MRRRLSIVVLATFIVASLMQVGELNSNVTSPAQAASYSCGNAAIGNISCSGYMGTIRCNITGSLGINGSAGCTNSEGKTVYCSSNFLFGGMNVDCPAFPIPLPTPKPTPTYSYSYPTPKPTPSSSYSNGYPVPIQTYSSGTTQTFACTGIPALPILVASEDLQGVTFSVTGGNSGQPTNLFSWSYSMYDSANTSWDAWSAYSMTDNGNPFSERFNLTLNKTKIAFSVFATNVCGSTGIVRESSDNKGIPLGLVPVPDETTIALTQDAFDASADASNSAYSESTTAINAAQDALDAVSALGLQVSALLDNVRQLAEVVAKIKKKV
jgi:hypothetical protein